MVGHGIASADGMTLVGPGIIGDFSDGVKASVPLTVNNYAANTMTINKNGFSTVAALDKKVRRSLDPM